MQNKKVTEIKTLFELLLTVISMYIYNIDWAHKVLIPVCPLKFVKKIVPRPHTNETILLHFAFLNQSVILGNWHFFLLKLALSSPNNH